MNTHVLRVTPRIHANSANGQRRRSVRCYARTTRRAPLRKRCGALASRRATRRTWRSSHVNVRRQRRGPDDVWRNCSSNGRRRLTYHRARGTCARRKSRAFHRRELPGVRRGVATPGRPLAASGRMLSEAAPRRPPEPGEQQASEGRRRLLRSVATGVVATRNRSRETWAEWSWPASRRPGLIYRFGIPSECNARDGNRLERPRFAHACSADERSIEMVVRIAYH